MTGWAPRTIGSNPRWTDPPRRTTDSARRRNHPPLPMRDAPPLPIGDPRPLPIRDAPLAPPRAPSLPPPRAAASATNNPVASKHISTGRGLQSQLPRALLAMTQPSRNHRNALVHCLTEKRKVTGATHYIGLAQAVYSSPMLTTMSVPASHILSGHHISPIHPRPERFLCSRRPCPSGYSFNHAEPAAARGRQPQLTGTTTAATDGHAWHNDRNDRVQLATTYAGMRRWLRFAGPARDPEVS